MKYFISSGNDDGALEVLNAEPVELHFKRKIFQPRAYDLELIGYSADPKLYASSKRDPFTLRIRLIVTN